MMVVDILLLFIIFIIMGLVKNGKKENLQIQNIFFKILYVFFFDNFQQIPDLDVN
jgi:hypothetical protein